MEDVTPELIMPVTVDVPDDELPRKMLRLLIMRGDEVLKESEDPKPGTTITVDGVELDLANTVNLRQNVSCVSEGWDRAMVVDRQPLVTVEMEQPLHARMEVFNLHRNKNKLGDSNYFLKKQLIRVFLGLLLILRNLRLSPIDKCFLSPYL